METVAASYIFCLVFDVYKRAKKTEKMCFPPPSLCLSLSFSFGRKIIYYLL